MVVTDNPTDPGNFEESLVACVADIADLLPELGSRYDSTVILSALAEHIGSALKILMLRQICDSRQARLVIKNIEDCAFSGKPAQFKIQ